MTTRAAIYRRISTSAQEDNTSLEVQYDDCREYGERKNYDIVATFTDVHSGMDLWNRTNLWQMLDQAEAGKFEVLIVWHTSRLARKTEDQAFIRVKLKRQGVRVESVKNPRTDGFEGSVMATFQSLFDQHDHAQIQARLAAGRRHRVEKEKRLQPGSAPLFGYQFDDPAKGEKNRYLEDPAKSWIVRRIFREAVECKSLRQIAKGLNDDGIKTTQGKTWGARQVSRILAHPYYRGHTATNRYTSFANDNGKRVTAERPESEWYLSPGLAPRIVDDETWFKANERLETNRRECTRPYDQATDALLRAGYVFCASCGGHMSVHRQHGRVYYRCNNAHFGTSKTCGGKNIEASNLDEFVWNRVSSWLGDPGVLLHEARQNRPALEEAMAEDLSVFEEGLKRIGDEQDALARMVGRLTDAAATPILDRLTGLGSELAALLVEQQSAIERVEIAKQTVEVVESLWTEIFAYAEGVSEWNYEQKRELLHRMGVRVTVEKLGVGHARFWVDVSPPWPEGTEWGLFGAYRNGPWYQQKGNGAVTTVVALVLAAIGSNTASQVSG